MILSGFRIFFYETLKKRFCDKDTMVSKLTLDDERQRVVGIEIERGRGSKLYTEFWYIFITPKT